MASRVIQLDDAHLHKLVAARIPFKDVTARERHLKLTINRLRCELAGEGRRFFVVERRKLARLSRIAFLAGQLPLAAWARKHPGKAELVRELQKELRALRGRRAPAELMEELAARP